MLAGADTQLLRPHLYARISQKADRHGRLHPRRQFRVPLERRTHFLPSTAVDDFHLVVFGLSHQMTVVLMHRSI